MTEQLLSERPSSLSSERDSNYPNIRFEPGIHPPKEGIESIIEQFRGGNTDIYTWNLEVGERISRYSPEILAIDGLFPSPGFFVESELIWLGFPCRPSKINKESEISVVLGDFSYSEVMVNVLCKMWQAGGEDILQEIGDLKKWGQNLSEKDSRKNQLRYVSEPLAIAALAAGVNAALLLSEREEQRRREGQREEKKTRQKRRISRRHFLKVAGLSGLSLSLSALSLSTSLGRVILPLYSAELQEGPLKKKIDKIVDILAPRVIKQESIDGRTALLIAKEEDSIDFLGKPKTMPGVVLLGAHHLPGTKGLLSNSLVRKEAISKYAKNLVSAFDEIADQYNFPREEVRRVTLDFMAMTEIAEVKDPGGELSLSSIRDSIRRVGGFQSPQVEAAIKQFRK